VFCEEYNPSWSWYRGDAGSTAIFEMTGGERFVFTGSWCSPGEETSWNAAWRISGEHGTVLWDGDNEPVSSLPAALGSGEDPGQEIAGSLRDFVSAVRTGSTPMGRVHQNIMSLAMVEASVRSAATGSRVSVDGLLEESYQQAILAERDPAVLEVLKSWTSVRSALAGESVAL
jgi:predicted dehydrogenase